MGKQAFFMAGVCLVSATALLGAMFALTFGIVAEKEEKTTVELPAYDVLAVPTDTNSVTCFMLLRADRTVSQMSCVEITGGIYERNSSRP